MCAQKQTKRTNHLAKERKQVVEKAQKENEFIYQVRKSLGASRKRTKKKARNRPIGKGKKNNKSLFLKEKERKRSQKTAQKYT